MHNKITGRVWCSKMKNAKEQQLHKKQFSRNKIEKLKQDPIFQP